MNADTLNQKVLSFLREFDGKNFSGLDIKNYFSLSERKIIFLDNCNYFFYLPLTKKCLDIRKVFSKEELDKLYSENVRIDRLITFYENDDDIIRIISDKKNKSAGVHQFIASKLSNDEARMKAFNMVLPEFKCYYLASLESDELKLKYLKTIKKEERAFVIKTFHNKKLIENTLSLFCPNKGDIISSLTDDEKKSYYLKKYFRFLADDEKINIIESFKDENKIIEFLNYCNNDIKVCIICSNELSYNALDQILKSVKSEKDVVDILVSGSVNNNLYPFKLRYIDIIKSKKEFQTLFLSLNDKDKLNYLYKFDDKTKAKLIAEFWNAKCVFEAFKQLEDKNLMIPIIEHTDTFPAYKDEYEYIVDFYAQKYNLNKDRLLSVVKNISFSVLKVINNENIIKILKSNENEFETILKIFNKQDLTMNNSAMNDILNTLLQRNFKLIRQDVILIFPTILNAINSNNKNIVIEKLNIIAKDININDEISRNGWDLEQFVNLLLLKDEKAINNLHDITLKYIIYQRNLYIQENIFQEMSKCVNLKFEKNDFMKYIITNLPTYLILDYLKACVKKNGNMEKEEAALIDNVDLLKRIIDYKKHAKDYQEIPVDVKSNMKAFNLLFERFSRSIYYDLNKTPIKKDYTFKEINPDYLVEILMNLDIDKMRNGLLNDSSLFNKFLKIWQQYKIGGWGKTFNRIFEKSNIDIDAEVIANFIQYFNYSYESLQKKVETGDLANISLTSLLDLASCYSSESRKYSLLFGKNDFRFISSNPGPNSSPMDKEKRIANALSLLKKTRSRTFVTVPPLDQDITLKNDKKINVVVGNSSNPINLTYGERTGACMRIGGAGESLFNFCLEDENGFHIRFSNPVNGKFISRVSGFRNGNTVFLNELRNSEDADYSNSDVVEACKLVSEEIIKLSQNSSLPINNVVVSPAYAMNNSNMTQVDLGVDDIQKGLKHFYTDVSSKAIVLATSSSNERFSPIRLGMKAPKYKTQRDKQKILYNAECQEYVAHLKFLDEFLSGKKLEDIDEFNDENLRICYAGEDWYVAIDKYGNFTEYIMKNSNDRSQAILEAKNALKYLKENINMETVISNSVTL